MNRLEWVSSSLPDDELSQLVAAYCDGRVSQRDCDRLESLLRGNAEARSFYLNYVRVHAALQIRSRPGPMLAEVALNATDSDIRVKSLQLGGQKQANSKLQGRLFPLSMIAVACSVAIALFVAFCWDTPPAGIPQGVPPVVHAPVVLAGDQPALLARVQLHTEETRFIPLADFGHVMVEGPADMEFVTPMRARLHKGRIKLRITSDKGHGLVVETPHGEVKDLGTEFGIDATSESENGVVVFEGKVDLTVQKAKGPAGSTQTEHLVQGEGLIFNRRGRLSRIMSIVTGEIATFEQGGDMRIQRLDPVIANVADSIQDDVRKFYEIVPGGLGEDVLAYVDRPQHEWNGMDEHGMPAYLVGADYVKPFCNDKMRRDVEISVTLGRPARLFVFLDDRVSPPDWLLREFTDTGDDIGLDNGRFVTPDFVWEFERGVGPGNSIDVRFSVWEQVIKKPGVIKLGPNSGDSWNTGMYAVAAVGLDATGTSRHDAGASPSESRGEAGVRPSVERQN